MNKWNQIVGHEWAVDLLKGEIIHDRVGHAYLITGPRQVGKATLARTFAMALNCEAEAMEDRPCGRCRPCTLIAAGHHPDVRLLLPEVSGRGKLTLKIDQIRDLQQELSLTATEARYKIAILKQFDAANPSAANAFLKTLEEPPSHVILLLTASEADSLLPTITSRCRTIALRPVLPSTIEQVLQTGYQTEREQARLLSNLANGRLGWAIQATQEPALLAERESQMGLLKEVLAATRVVRFDIAEKLARQPENLPDVLQTWLSWWRDLVILNWGSAGTRGHTQITNVDHLAWLQNSASAYTAPDTTSSLKRTEKSLWDLEHNANARLVLENLFLKYPPAHLVSALPG
ncbi:MAG: DNA polymerase III subunit delta' [Candidatus Promineifilaceae bacterium]